MTRSTRPWYVTACIGFIAGMIVTKLMPIYHLNNWQWWAAGVPAIVLVEFGYYLIKKIIGEDNAT